MCSSDLAASHCHLTPGECGTRLQAVTLKFLEQNNLVKAQEALEKLINYGYLVGDKGALVAARPLLQRFAEKSRENAELSAQLQQLERWLDALQQENLSQIHALAAEDVIKQLVAVQTALRLYNTARAAEYLAKFSAQREDYWRLKAQFATLQKDLAAAQSAQSELANLQARALAVLGD